MMQTECRSARLLAKSSSTLLEDLTSPLASRIDAARMFHHVLGKSSKIDMFRFILFDMLTIYIRYAVGVTKGFVRAEQEKPYGSIKVLFDF